MDIQATSEIVAQLKYRYDNTKEKDFRNLLLLVSDYLQFLLQTPLGNKILEKIKELNRLDDEKLKALEKVFQEEIDKATLTLVEIVDKNKIQGNVISQLKEVTEWRNLTRQSLTSQTSVQAQYNILTSILVTLYNEGHIKLIKDLVVIEDNQIVKFKICPSSKKYNDLVEKIKWVYESSVRSDWDKIALIHDVINNFDEIVTIATDKKNTFGFRLRIGQSITEIQEIIRTGKRSNSEFSFIREKETRDALTRLHLFSLDMVIDGNEIKKPVLTIPQAIKTEGWHWVSKDEGVYWFGKEFKQDGQKIRKKVFIAMMDLYEKSGGEVSLESVKVETGLPDNDRTRIEIIAISNNLTKKVGLQVEFSGKGTFSIIPAKTEENNGETTPITP